MIVSLGAPRGVLGRAVLPPLQAAVCRAVGRQSGFCVHDPGPELPSQTSNHTADGSYRAAIRRFAFSPIESANRAPHQAQLRPAGYAEICGILGGVGIGVKPNRSQVSIVKPVRSIAERVSRARWQPPDRCG